MIRIDERRNDKLIHLFEYSEKSSYANQSQDQLGHKIEEQKIAALASNILQRVFPAGKANQGSTEEHENAITKDNE